MSLIPTTIHSVTEAEAELFRANGVRYGRALCGVQAHRSQLHVRGATCKRCLRMLEKGTPRKRPIVYRHLIDSNKIITPEKPYFHVPD